MAGQLDLPFWPSTIDCLDWSQDNTIAVAGGDSIGILTPRYREPGPSGSQWDSTTFKANAFTADEIPLVDTLSFRNFDIGEELSTRQVQALKWSFRGLGRYGRCVLAVLSSNHVLSIWENSAKAGSSQEWSRVAIVNHALQRHYSERTKPPKQTQTEFNEQQIISQRVRSFSWSPSLFDQSGANGSAAPFTDNGDQFLAVSTENGHILVLRIFSANDLLSPLRTEWTVEVIQTFDVSASVIEHYKLITVGEDIEDQGTTAKDTYVADHLAWGPFRSHPGSVEQSCLAFVARRRLFCITADCNVKHEPLTITLLSESCRDALPVRSDLTGPLRFVPKTQFVVAFAADTVCCIDTAKSFNDDKNPSCHHLDGRWDEVTGVAFSDTSTNGLQLHLTSLLSSSTASTTTLSLPLDKEEVATQPPWQAALLRLKTVFSAQYKLRDHVQDRVWGMAASPMGDFIATATVLLPSDTINYVQQAEQVTSVTITSQADDSRDLLRLDGGTANVSRLSTSTMLFSLIQNLRENDHAFGSTAIIEAMQRCAQLPDDQTVFDLRYPDVHEIRPIELVRYFRQCLFLAPELRAARCKLIAEFARKEADNADQVTKVIISSLVDAVLQIPSEYNQAGPLSQRILDAYTTLRSRLNRVGPTDATNQSHSEVCQICQELITFESVKWARCVKGHQFTRCGLTFLAMQKPGMSKSCTLCGMQYIDEYQLLGKRGAKEPEDIEMTDVRDPQLDANGGSGDDKTLRGGWVELSNGIYPAEPEKSLSRILFAAFDRCVYCGGDF